MVVGDMSELRRGWLSESLHCSSTTSPMPRLLVHRYSISLDGYDAGTLRSLRALGLAMFVSASSGILAQNYIPELSQKSIAYFDSLERSLGSEPYAYRARLMTQLSQPVCFVRTNHNFRPRPLVSYLYSQNDSRVRQIEVEIDSLNFLPNTYDARHGYHEPNDRRMSSCRCTIPFSGS